LLGDSGLTVQPINHRDGRRTHTILDLTAVGVHARADGWLRGYQPGTQRTYAHALVDHLRWLRSVGRTEETVTFADLRRYMALCGATNAGPMGVPWLASPLGESALQVRATVLKAYYLHVTTAEDINPQLKEALVVSSLPHRAKRDVRFLEHLGAGPQLANPLASGSTPKRRPRLLPDGVVPALLDAAGTSRDRMIVTWLADSGCRVGELCGLRMSDLHLTKNHGCGEEPLPHFHVVRRDDNPNGARAKTASAARRGESQVQGGSIRFASPAMVETYLEYITTDRYDLRALATHDLLLIQLHDTPSGRAGDALSTAGVRQMLERLGARAGAGTIRPHAFRHSWATALTEASGNAAITARAGGWSTSKTVEETYAHLAGSTALENALMKVWDREDAVDD
jgi:integrase